jgi:hypothetical protein
MMVVGALFSLACWTGVLGVKYNVFASRAAGRFPLPYPRPSPRFGRNTKLYFGPVGICGRD